MGTTDRAIRTAVAVVAVVVAALAGWTSVVGVVALVLAGVMLLTSALGYCPIYTLVGVDTRRPRDRAAV
jgi:hypothetical protein